MNLQSKNGFTLIELLLYVSISSIILLAVSLFLQTLLEARVKNQAIAEVEQQGIQAMRLITQNIRNAEAVNSPVQGISSSSLSLDVVDAENDPILFDLSTGAIRIKEGAGSAIALTNSRVAASELSFQNLSRAGTNGIIRIFFILSHINPENRNEYNYSKTFYGSASLR